MAPKYILSTRYPFLHRYNSDLPRQIEALRRDNEGLRVKLVAVQETKVAAIRQAENLRKEKERLRAKVASLKQKLTQSELKNEQLAARIGELQEAVESLSSRPS
jgi:chromosome segregation ATPase